MNCRKELADLYVCLCIDKGSNSNSNLCDRTEMDSYRQEKVQKFEEFVDRRLKPDLVRAIAER